MKSVLSGLTIAAAMVAGLAVLFPMLSKVVFKGPRRFLYSAVAMVTVVTSVTVAALLLGVDDPALAQGYRIWGLGFAASAVACLAVGCAVGARLAFVRADDPTVSRRDNKWLLWVALTLAATTGGAAYWLLS